MLQAICTGRETDQEKGRVVERAKVAMRMCLSNFCYSLAQRPGAGLEIGRELFARAR